MANEGMIHMDTTSKTSRLADMVQGRFSVALVVIPVCKVNSIRSEGSSHEEKIAGVTHFLHFHREFMLRDAPSFHGLSINTPAYRETMGSWQRWESCTCFTQYPISDGKREERQSIFQIRTYEECDGTTGKVWSGNLPILKRRIHSVEVPGGSMPNPLAPGVMVVSSNACHFV